MKIEYVFIKHVLCSSRTVAPEENYPPTLKLILTLTGGDNFLQGQLSGYRFMLSRSSHQRCSVEKAVVKKFAIYTVKTRPVLESLFNKVLQVCNFIKKRLQHRCFPMNIAKVLRATIFKNIWERLLLVIWAGGILKWPYSDQPFVYHKNSFVIGRCRFTQSFF